MMTTFQSLPVAERVRFLSISELFRDIHPADLEEIQTLLNEEKFEKDSQIFLEDDRGDNLYLLFSGSVKITLRAVWRMETENLIKMIRPGEIFGEFSFIDGARRSASAEALEDSVALVLTRPDFNTYAVEKPSVALNVMHNFAWLLTNKIRNTTMLYRSSIP